jgi:hypothetical protein
MSKPRAMLLLPLILAACSIDPERPTLATCEALKPSEVPGITVVQERFRVRDPYDVVERWALLIEGPDVTTIQPRAWPSDPPPPEATTAERELMQAPPRNPGNGCSPGGVRRDFWLRGVRHWRCIY